MLNTNVWLYHINNSCMFPEVHKKNKSAEIMLEDEVDTYHSLEKFVKNGKVRSLGLSDFNITELQRIISNAI